MNISTSQHPNTSTSQHPNTSPLLRLITICGSIQLVSAIAAIRTWEIQNPKRTFKNILLFYSLNQDSTESTNRFLEVLVKMAKQLISADELWYWSPTGSYPSSLTPLTPKGEPKSQLYNNSAFGTQHSKTPPIQLLNSTFDILNSSAAPLAPKGEPLPAVSSKTQFPNNLINKPQTTNEKSSSTIRSTLYPLLSTPDYIWINSTFHPEIKKLCRQYPQAKTIAYGDGPGIYFTENCKYIFPQEPISTSPIRKIKNLIKTLSANFLSWCLSGKKQAYKVTDGLKPKEGYFLFPTIFEEPPSDLPYTTIKAATFYQIFKEIKPLFDFTFLDKIMESFLLNHSSNPTPRIPNGETHTNHQPRANSYQLRAIPPLTILLTANLSEAGRMEEYGELTAYENILKQQAFPSGIILIKPHPRDGQEKIKRLKTNLEQDFGQVAILDNPFSQYIPFELFVMHWQEKYYQNQKAFSNRVRIITTSTACLTLAKVFGLTCIIGLQENDLKKYFSKNALLDRLEHNQVLRSTVQQIIESNQRNYAAA